MKGPLTTRSALLLLLAEAPAFGAALIGLFERRTGRPGGLAGARVYPVLRALEAEGLVKSFRIVPGGRRGGRARLYYDLTPRGRRASARERQVLLRLLCPQPGPAPAAHERDHMAARLIEADELSQASLELACAQRKGGAWLPGSS